MLRCAAKNVSCGSCLKDKCASFLIINKGSWSAQRKKEVNFRELWQAAAEIYGSGCREELDRQKGKLRA